jgi:BirA family biotin operon repressor/biotin-[acetyl-CoA-carboxylase] ligase
VDFDAYLKDLERARPAHEDPEDRGPENLVVLRRISSTNRIAREVVAEYEREAQHLYPLLVLAFEQTGGRGRQGRAWSSPAGQGVYATRVLTVDDVELLQSLPLLVGIGLCRGMARHLPAPCRLKWPNDLIVETPEGRRKIGGILIEALVRPGPSQDQSAAAIIGFGLNHGATDELPETGTSVRRLGGDAALADFTWEVIAGLERELRHLGDLPYAVAAYRELSIHRPGDAISARVGDTVVEGRFTGFDERGRLLLDRDGEEMRLTAGEVIE